MFKNYLYCLGPSTLHLKHFDALWYKTAVPERDMDLCGIFKQSMGARNRVGIGCRTDPLGNIGWRNLFH